MSFTEEQRKRFASFDSIMDAVRVANDTALVRRGLSYETRTAINWLRSLSNETLHLYQTMVETLSAVDDYRGEPIFPAEFVMSAADRNLDDHEAALAAYLMLHTSEAPWDSTGASGREGHLHRPFDNTISKIKVLHQTIIFHHRKLIPEELYAAVIHTGVFSASEETLAQMKSVLEVTLAVWKVAPRSDAIYQMSSNGSAPVLRDEELVKLSIDYADKAMELCSVIKFRESYNHAVIREIMKSGNTAMASGHL